MSLGEQINRLRAANNMSQGDLAEALGVSRQSISKWETDGATPELDKLVKLSALFGVTLDELVTGKAPERPESPPPQVIVERRGMPGRQVAGIVLLCMAFAVILLFTALGGLLEGLIFCLPFLVCGVICFNAKKHPGLWCVWALFLLVDGYLRYATGLSWTMVRWTLQWEWSWNYARLAIAWCQLLCGLAVLGATVVRLGKGTVEWTKRNKALLVGGAAAFALLCLPLSSWIFRVGGMTVAAGRLSVFAGWLQDSLRLALLAAGLTALVRGRRR